MRTTILAIAIALAACVTPGPVPPDPTPSPDVYARACAKLAAIGCPEGARESCARVMQDAQEARATDLRPECLAKADSIEAARACGSVRCR
jgi:hypothetical protein